MSESIPQVTALMQEMAFTSEDLILNREGLLSIPQKERLKAMRQRVVLVGAVAFIVLVLIATMLFFVSVENESPILSIIGMVIVLINALMIGMVARQWMRLSRDYHLEQAAIVTGTLERIVRPSGRVNNYVLRVDEVEYPVKKEVFKLFRHEKPYALYSTPYSHILLSAEPLEEI